MKPMDEKTKKIIFAWSGGKDSAMALHELQKNKNYEISTLLTTITEDYDRISMHGVRRLLLERQAVSLGFPLEKVPITKSSSNEDYESKMADVLARYKKIGVSSVAFGDIFLEDIRKYREDKMSLAGMAAIFPIWKSDTKELAHKFIDLGFKAVITCVDSKMLDGTFAGRIFDRQFVADLPLGVDPCGENGEFHTFVYDGPIFREPVRFQKGEVILRDNRFWYCDLLLSVY
ncbi:MAG: diphthine--ammonia ligase [Candidatus Omnitrophica bacterium]|nr:diphthine--ammonia ligase [Candidatus Omnitrophota bacterium]MBU4488853.1 diphthine--ammonia ligase [Candidatus Omnitrophota bacterium]